jgi:hypothetical protein
MRAVFDRPQAFEAQKNIFKNLKKVLAFSDKVC